MSNPLVTIICPVYNAAESLPTTIRAIAAQTYENIEFIIVDGKSTDGTNLIAAEFSNVVTNFISEEDEGMYDALSKGFIHGHGEIFCYINAGDFLTPFAVSTAVEIITENKVDWISGYRSICNNANVVTHIDLPFRYIRSLIQVGSYAKHLPFIQQETCFWTRHLVEKTDLQRLRTFRYAGDYYLWWTFSAHSELEIVSCPLGVFKKHPGQLSEDREAYLNEVNSFTFKRKLSHILKEKIELLGWALHPRLRALFRQSIFRYNHQKLTWEKSPFNARAGT